MSIFEIVVFVACLTPIILGFFSYVQKLVDFKAKDEPVLHDHPWGSLGMVMVREATTLEGPGGKYRVELQDNARWAVEHLFNGLAGTTFMDDHPTRAQALDYARRYARLPEFDTDPLPDHPLPDRRAAIAHTKAQHGT